MRNLAVSVLIAEYESRAAGVWSYPEGPTHHTRADLGIIEMGARLYAPLLGRFLQTDPVPGGSANPYDYCRQDPINFLDLDGRWPHIHWKKVFHVARFLAEGAAVTVGIGAFCGLTVAIGCAIGIGALGGAFFGGANYLMDNGRRATGRGLVEADLRGAAGGAVGRGSLHYLSKGASISGLSFARHAVRQIWRHFFRFGMK